ncbi:ribosomal RNA large subunit methyltransferase I [Clostridium tepidiprofundi DSM 19306]|uniref:Ribosomal RNA large subunit methyltransferase I n=1 Tax=Clostridium tepidiprofundi DSM 19306 TaxID=1121338 RepID=A0A151B4W6_9CLOT|nr:class I SAM-dependent rRNA methyltransferase [Clostridium tepidiprofundi]KYH34961.1 ribosomal RNA large subunit methyltransferase I [Clostridium tepidiprofundi DSM 19306]
MKEIKLIIKKEFKDKYFRGYPLIMTEAILNPQDIKEGRTAILFDQSNRFIGRGYLGNQNKGCGWILTRGKKGLIDYKLFYNKIRNAIEKRRNFYFSKDTNAFRVFNGEGDGIGGLTIDYFDGYYLINWYSGGIYSFKDFILKVLTTLVPYKGIYQKKRFNSGGKYIEEDSFVMGRKAPKPLIIKENGINYAIYLNEGAMVGIFLDQRNVRKALRDNYCKNKSVLNTFSYTGAFSVAAALGEASKTTSVDLASRSLNKTIENFTINNIDHTKHDIVVKDIFDYFTESKRNNTKFDVIILDPPSFATSKKSKFSAESDYTNLLKQAIEITNQNGLIVASTNCSSFNMKKFKGFIEKAFNSLNRKYNIIEEYRLPCDFAVIDEFPEGNYLKVVFIRLA